MAIDPKFARPKRFPAPEFPPRKIARFAKMPPAVFPVLLGVLGLGLALRRLLVGTALEGVVEAVLGALLALWLFAAVAMMGKIARRPAVLLEDLRVLPGRSGMAASTMAGMAAAVVLVPYAPVAALGLLWLALALHGVLALALVWVMISTPGEARQVTPAWHLSFVGFIVGALAAVPLGQIWLAEGLLWAMVPVAAAIWAVTLGQLVRRIPPAPLRPLLAIHLAPAALFVTVAASLGHMGLANGFAVLAVAIATALLISLRWVLASGFSALWGAFTFPLAALASALLAVGGVWYWPGVALAIAAAIVVPMIAARVVKMWATGALAGKTNAAEA